MRLLLDQCLPRSTVLHLQNAGIEAAHVGDMGLATASDAEILHIGRLEGSVVVTLNADFHTVLALSGTTGPTVIRIRIEGLRAEDLAGVLVKVLEICKDDLMKGATVSVTENGVRVRLLPLLREKGSPASCWQNCNAWSRPSTSKSIFPPGHIVSGVFTPVLAKHTKNLSLVDRRARKR